LTRVLRVFVLPVYHLGTGFGEAGGKEMSGSGVFFNAVFKDALGDWSRHRYDDKVIGSGMSNRLHSSAHRLL